MFTISAMATPSKIDKQSQPPETESDIRHHAASKSLLHPLAFLASDFRDRIRAGLQERNHRLQPAHAKVLVHMDIHGSRLTDLAERAGISKQAMGKVIDELESLGYVSRGSHQDGRAKVIQFTRKGRSLLRDAGESVDAAWEQYGKLFGEKRLAKFRDELQSLYSCVRDGSRNA
jgi:DNA-binding MarR family transcriptional regulator